MPRSLQLPALIAALSLLAATSGSSGELTCGEWAVVLAGAGAPLRIEHRGEPRLESGPLAAPSISRVGYPPYASADWTETDLGDALAFAASYPAVATGLAADVEVTRSQSLGRSCYEGLTIAEDLAIRPEAALAEPFDYRVPLVRLPARDGEVFLPRRDGFGEHLAADGLPCASYTIGGAVPEPGCTELALPLVDLPLAGGHRLAVYADPLFTTTFVFEPDGPGLVVSLAWRYRADRVAVASHRRDLRLHVHSTGPASAIDAFAAELTVASHPRWLDDITLTYFDYMAEAGRGWYDDLDALAAWIPAGERHRVAVTVHGWYDLIGSYAYDHTGDRFLDAWYVQPKRYGTSVAMSTDLVRERLDHARGLGFRTLLYFADGLSIDDTTARGAATDPELGINPWNGPEVEGTLLIQNPASPEVRGWFAAYLAAFLREFGDHVDGLVWDETFWIPQGAVATDPEPALADVAMMTLTRELTAQVEAYRSDLALLTSDAIGPPRLDVPPYALMGHGTFQDTECDPESWSYGLLANWRKPLWSVNWGARTRFEDMRLGVLAFGAPVALSNGYADDWGPAEMAPELAARAVELADLLAAPGGRSLRPPYLTEAPATYLARPLPGELVVSCWRIAGPYPNDGDTGFDAVYPPELGRTRLGWIPAPVDRSGYLDLATTPLGGDWRIAYAEAWLTASAPVEVDLVVGSDDGIKVWLDGAEVLRHHVHRTHWPGADVVRALAIAPGEHRLLVKSEQATDSWGISVRLQDPEYGNALSCRRMVLPPPRDRLPVVATAGARPATPEVGSPFADAGGPP